MGPPGLTSPSDGRIAINSTYAFTSYALWRDLVFNPGVFGTETSDLSFASSSLLVSGGNFLLKIPILPGMEPKTAASRAVTVSAPHRWT